MTRPASHPCPIVGCPHLQPCPTHTPNPSAHRSDWRDRDKQKWFRRGLELRNDGACQRCGARGIQLFAHHDRPGWDLDHGRMLCRDCHRAIDNMAR